MLNLVPPCMSTAASCSCSAATCIYHRTLPSVPVLLLGTLTSRHVCYPQPLPPCCSPIPGSLTRRGSTTSARCAPVGGSCPCSSALPAFSALHACFLHYLREPAPARSCWCALTPPIPPTHCNHRQALNDAAYNGLDYVPYCSTMPVQQHDDNPKWIWKKKGAVKH